MTRKTVQIEVGTYVGAGCSIIVSKGDKTQQTLSEIVVVVSEEQLEMLKKYRNYEFHFDYDGKLSGTGTITTSLGKNKGEIIDRKISKANELERDVLKTQ